jgi:maltooligosyltrehalose synthase
LYPELFAEGEYIALPTAGTYRHHVCAFLRRRSGQTVVVTAPRLLWKLTGGDPGIRPLGKVWKDTKLELPAEYEASVFRCQFSGRRLRTVEDSGRLFLSCSRILEHFPVGLLVKS